MDEQIKISVGPPSPVIIFVSLLFEFISSMTVRVRTIKFSVEIIIRSNHKSPESS